MSPDATHCIKPCLADTLAAGLAQGWALRPRIEADLPFLLQVYASAREEELRPVQWSEHERNTFLQDQFSRQHEDYLAHYPQAQWLVVTLRGVPVGRIYIDESSQALQLMDVALMAQQRNAGVGSALMRGLLDYADERGLPVTLYVEPTNRAMRLYRRFGFRPIDTTSHYYHLMERAPGCGVEVN